jgi:hypothetical protein
LPGRRDETTKTSARKTAFFTKNNNGKKKGVTVLVLN